MIHLDGKRLLSEGLQPECQIACICASTKFDDICVELQQGDVSLHDLQKMKEKEVQLRRLCEAVSGPEDTEKLSQKAVLECLYQRLEEFDRFSTRQQAYLDVCKWIPDPKCINGKLIEDLVSYLASYRCQGAMPSWLNLKYTLTLLTPRHVGLQLSSGLSLYHCIIQNCSPGAQTNQHQHAWTSYDAFRNVIVAIKSCRESSGVESCKGFIHCTVAFSTRSLMWC